MAHDIIDHPQPQLILSLIFIVTMLSPTHKVLISLKGVLFLTPHIPHPPMARRSLPSERTQFPYLSWTSPPQIPWFTEKLHSPSTLFGRCLRSRDCIPPPNWFLSWASISLWTLDMHSRRRRACPILSETGWFASRLSDRRPSSMKTWMRLPQTWAMNLPSNTPVSNWWDILTETYFIENLIFFTYLLHK